MGNLLSLSNKMASFPPWYSRVLKAKRFFLLFDFSHTFFFPFFPPLQELLTTITRINRYNSLLIAPKWISNFGRFVLFFTFCFVFRSHSQHSWHTMHIIYVFTVYVPMNVTRRLFYLMDSWDHLISATLNWDFFDLFMRRFVEDS